MIELFNSESAHSNIMYWWMGQVVDESCWVGNSNFKIHDRDDVDGWGKRYKIRIFGRDTQVKSVPDEELEMAEILYPPTAGTGHGGSYQTTNIRQGSYVVGFYKDGINGTEPIILGCLGNNSQTRLYGGDPPQGYIPRDGFFGLSEKKPVSNKDQYTSPGSAATNNSKQEQNTNTKDLHIQLADGLIYDVVLKTIECDGPGGEMKGIQGAIQKALATIARIKLAATSHLNAAMSVTASISSVVNSTVSFITGLTKKIIEKMRGYVLNKINNGVKDVATILFPNQRWDFSKKAEEATDTLGCVFNKIIGGLLNLIKNLFANLLDAFISGPLCAVEQFMGDLISNILGPILNGINGVLSTINGIINTIGNFASKAFQILDFVTGLLNFLKCEQTASCEYKDKWSIWNGSKTASNISNGLNNLLNDIDASLGGESTTPSGCNTGTLPCGPPSIRITGGNGGLGAAANAVVGVAGEILALDFSSFGSGYRSTPAIEIDDQCNSGGGAQIVLITSSGDGENTDYKTSGEDGEDVVISGAVVDPNNSGVGYLPVQDGSRGGDGYKISNPEDTILIKNPDTIPVKNITDVINNTNPTWEVLPPGTDSFVNPGDRLCLPPGTVVEIFDNSGNIVEVLNGSGQESCFTINTGGSFTSPSYEKEQLPEGSTYNVLVLLDDVIINNPGLNYSPGDTITVSPDTGVELSPEFDDLGQIKKVNIISKGKSFNTMPTITVNSQTGLNADIWPVFKVNKIEDETELDEGQIILSVIDCVGKYQI
jgi:hypothetical protein